MRTRVFHSTCRGAGHLALDKPCQDYSHSETRWGNGVCDLVVVSDGHGSGRFFRSDRGSMMAVRVSEEAVRLFVRDFHPDEIPPVLSRGIAQVKDCDSSDFTPEGDPNERAFRSLARYIITRWHEEVTADWEADPPGDDEVGPYGEQPPVMAYGCTLLVAFRTEEYWASLQLGDGDIVAFWPDGSWSAPVHWDSECALNCTTSLCSHREDRFRYCYGSAQPVALFLSSDGVGGSFPGPDQLAGFYEAVLFRLARGPFAEVAEQLEGCLPELSRTGSQDDMSLAFWYDDNAVPDFWYVVHRRRQEVLVKELEGFRKKIEGEIAHLQDSLSMLSERLRDYELPSL